MPVAIRGTNYTAFWTPDRVCSLVAVTFDKPTALLEVRHCQAMKALSSREIPPGESGAWKEIQVLQDVSKLEWRLETPIRLALGEVLLVRIRRVTGGVTARIEVADA